MKMRDGRDEAQLESMKTRLAFSQSTFVALPAVFSVISLTRSALRARSAQNAVVMPTESQLWAFLRELEAEKVAEVEHDVQGKVVSLTLRRTHATDQGLVYASLLDSLRSLAIHGRPLPSDYSESAAASLRNLINLVSLKVLCTGPLQPGFFRELCALRNLRELQLTDATPPKEEYSYLARLSRLERLGLASCTNFGDTELTVVTNLANLRSLKLIANGVTQQGTNVLRGMQGLTNLVFIPTEQLPNKHK
jgi:hypothetical protein